MPSSLNEKRLHKRLEVTIPAGIYFKNDSSKIFDAKIVDISEGGAYIQCSSTIEVGEEILIEIRFAGSRFLSATVVQNNKVMQGLHEQAPDPSPEKSIVRWVKKGTDFGFGIQFVNLKEDKRTFIRKLIAYFEDQKKKQAKE